MRRATMAEGYMTQLDRIEAEVAEIKQMLGMVLMILQDLYGDEEGDEPDSSLDGDTFGYGRSEDTPL